MSPPSWRWRSRVDRLKRWARIPVSRSAHDRLLRLERDRANQRIGEAEQALAKLAAEVTRLRFELRLGPSFTQRFIVSAAMDETFVHNARDLKELMGYIIPVLARRIEAEMAQVDFARLKPIDDGPRARGTRFVYETPSRGDRHHATRSP